MNRLRANPNERMVEEFFRNRLEIPKTYGNMCTTFCATEHLEKSPDNFPTNLYQTQESLDLDMSFVVNISFSKPLFWIPGNVNYKVTCE